MTTSQDLLERIDGQNLATRFLANAARNSDVEVIRWKDADGDWQSWTMAQLSEITARLVTGLAGLGVGKGDTVVLMLKNRPEFHAARPRRALPRRDAGVDLQLVGARADRVPRQRLQGEGRHRRERCVPRAVPEGALGAADPRAHRAPRGLRTGRRRRRPLRRPGRRRPPPIWTPTPTPRRSTTSPRSSTPRARPGRPRGSCSRTATSRGRSSRWG